MKTTSRLIVGLITALAAVLGLSIATAPQASAQAWKTPSACGPTPKIYHSNQWNFFAGHRMDVDLGMCSNGTWVKWAQNPQLSFPSRGNPSSPLEDITVTSGPTIYKTTPYLGGYSNIYWKYTVKQHIFGPLPDQTWVFTVEINNAYTQLCSVGGACDTPKNY